MARKSNPARPVRPRWQSSMDRTTTLAGRICHRWGRVTGGRQRHNLAATSVPATREGESTPATCARAPAPPANRGAKRRRAHPRPRPFSATQPQPESRGLGATSPSLPFAADGARVRRFSMCQEERCGVPARTFLGLQAVYLELGRMMHDEEGCSDP